MYLIDELLQVTSGKLLGLREHREVNSFTIDSRKCGNGACFLALKGEHVHGGEFIPAAFQNGASAAIIDRAWIEEKRHASKQDYVDLRAHHFNIIVVESVRETLWNLARFHRSRYSPLTIAVTGTAGKTSTKELLKQIFSTKFSVWASPSSFNNDLGVPLTILGLNESHQIYVQELGASEIGSIKRLAGLVRPNVGVLTVVGVAHLEGFGNVRDIYKAKLELADELCRTGGIFFFNGSDNTIRNYLQNKDLDNSPFLSPDSVWSVNNQIEKEKGWGFELANGETYWVPSPAPFQIGNAVAALAVGRTFGVSYSECRFALESMKWPPGRFNLTEIGEDILIIDDTYNANPTAFSASLKAMAGIKASRCFVVFGDMLELGARAQDYHESIGRQIAGLEIISGLITIGKESSHAHEAATNKRTGLMARHFDSNLDAALFLRSLLRTGDAVLVKGSRGMHLEEIVKDLKECFSPSPAS